MGELQRTPRSVRHRAQLVSPEPVAVCWRPSGDLQGVHIPERAHHCQPVENLGFDPCRLHIGHGAKSPRQEDSSPPARTAMSIVTSAVRGGAGSPVRHDGRAIGARHGTDPGPRSSHAVAQQPGETSGSGGSAEPSYSCARGCNVRNGEEGPERLTCSSRRGARIQHGAGVASESVTSIKPVMVSALLITEL